MFVVSVYSSRLFFDTSLTLPLLNAPPPRSMARRGSTINSDGVYENTGLRRASVKARISGQREIPAGWGTKYGPAPLSTDVKKWQRTHDSRDFATFSALYGGENAEILRTQAALNNRSDMRVRYKSQNLEGAVTQFALGQRVEIFWRGNWQHATVDYVDKSGVTVNEIACMSCDGRHIHVPFGEDGRCPPDRIRIIAGSKDPHSFTTSTPADRGEFAGRWSSYAESHYRTAAIVAPRGQAGNTDGWDTLTPREASPATAAAARPLPQWGAPDAAAAAAVARIRGAPLVPLPAASGRRGTAW